MLSKSQASLVTSLHLKKFRKEHGLFIAEGEKIVNDLLSSQLEIKKIFSTRQFQESHSKQKTKNVIEWIEVTEPELKKISALSTPHEVLAVAVIPEDALEKNAIVKSLSLLLDQINDPGNLGTIIRLADWFGIGNIICSRDCADCYNPKVVQASMGSLFRVNIHYSDLSEIFEWNRSGPGLSVFGTTLNGRNIYDAKLASNGFIVLGNESAGIRKELKKYFSEELSIPAFSAPDKNSTSTADSLNVAIAAAIICSEFRRRQME